MKDQQSESVSDQERAEVDNRPPFFPFGKQVGFHSKFGDKILFQCETTTRSKQLTDNLNQAWNDWKDYDRH